MNVKNQRQLMWDLKFCEENSNVQLILHHPVRKNVALSCDDPWEGDTCGYASTVKVGDVFAFITVRENRGLHRVPQRGLEKYVLRKAATAE